jgi:hypothetical protein
MTTALGLITKALQKNGVLIKSEAPATDEANDGLDALNALISSLSNDSMMIYGRTEDNTTLVAGTAEYTIGTSQTINTARPVYIVEAHVRQGSSDYSITSITDEAYQGIVDKSAQGMPIFYNYTNGFAAGKIKLWPTPDTAYTLYLLSEKPLSSLTLNQTISLPPGWERYLIHKLGVELAPDYGEAVDEKALARCERIAAESGAAIRRAIMKSRSMDFSPGVGNRSNIYTGV